MTTRQKPFSWKATITPWLFLLPAILIFVLFKFIPMIKGFDMSFYTINFDAPPEWVGIGNFERAMADTDLRYAIKNTAKYVAITVLLSAIIGFFLALILEGSTRHLKFMRTAIFLPAITSTAVVVEIWRTLLAPTQNGIVNEAISIFGIAPLGFFSDPQQAMASLMVMHIWKTAPYDMMIFIAGLATVNRELYDAAAVDGANWIHRLRYVTLPALHHTFVIVGLLGVIRGFRVFTEVYASTGGGPGGATEVVMTHIYKTGFAQFEFGYASAISFLLFIFTALTSLLYFVWRSRHQPRDN